MSGLLWRYRAERLPVLLVATVALLLAGAAQLAGQRAPAAFPRDYALAALLFITFRIVDDLADRPRDRAQHPERVLVRTPSTAPFVTTAAVLAATALVVLVARGASSVTAAGFVTLLAAWVACGMRGGPRSLVSDHLLLGKYPAFVWLIAATRGHPGATAPRLALALLATYLAGCVYEAVHDATSPGARWPGLIVAEALLLALALSALSLRGMA